MCYEVVMTHVLLNYFAPDKEGISIIRVIALVEGGFMPLIVDQRYSRGIVGITL